MDHSTPAVSVITIVKNNEVLLPRAVASVLGQRFSDFEYIIVNDGSSDGTTSLVERYAEKDPRIKPRHMPRNVGRAMARNAGVDEAKGRYVFFLDSDDYLPETALKDLWEVAEKDHADIVYGHIKSFDKGTGEWLPQYYTDLIISSERHNFRLGDHLDLVDNHQIVGQLYRKEFLQRKNIRFSARRRNAEDVLFSFLTAYHAENITMIPQKTVYYYCFGNQLDAANESKLFDARDNIIETIEFALKTGSDPLKRRMLQKGAMFAGYLYRVQKFYNGDEKKIMSYMETLVPLVENVTDQILKTLPAYTQRIVQALQKYDYKQAYHIWALRYLEIEKDQEIEDLKLENKKLACQLEELYNSTSWRITAPIRRFAMKFFKC